MDGKLEQIKYRGIERNSAEESATSGSAQELFNMRYKDGAWRNVKRKLKLGEYASTRKFIGWYSHPATDNQTFIAYNEDARKVAVINYVTDNQTWIVKRDGTDFVLPATETFNRFGHLENVLILFSNIQMYRFLWVNGKFEYVEFGDIEWTCEKGTTKEVTLNEVSANLTIGKYLATRSYDLSIGYIEGICAFRLVVQLFDDSCVWYSDIKILRGTGTRLIYAPYSGVNDSFRNCYEPRLYIPNDGAFGGVRMKYTSYLPVIQFEIPEWFYYYNELGLVKSINICATRPIYPYIPEFASGLWWNNGNHPSSGTSPDDLVNFWDLMPSTKPTPLFPKETDIFYSLWAVSENNLLPPSLTQAYNFTDLVTTINEIPIDNFTGNKTTALYNFNYNGRLHLEQITNTLALPFLLLNDYFPEWDNTSILLWNPVTPADYVPTTDYDMYVEVVIALNNNYFVVRKLLTDAYKLADTITATEESIWVGRFIHYPHVSAKLMRITFSKDGINFYKLKSPSINSHIFSVSALNIAKNKTPADSLENFTPYMYTDFEVIAYPYDPYTAYDNLRFLKMSVPPSGTDYETSPLCELVTEENGFYTDTNRLQLSELENPFVLPASSSYRFGDINNRINGIEVPREQLSETRFGQFPLYVFTTQGIWVLEQGTDVTYSNFYYLDKYICDNNNLIRAIQGFVCFSTAEGLYVVSGRSFQELSTVLEGNINCHIPQVNLDALQSFFADGVADNFYLSQLEFKTELPYMIMCFDYINKEIIFSMGLLAETDEVRKYINYSYVYSMESKSWHKISESFAYFVDTNPAVVGIKYSKEQGEKETFIYTYSFFDMHTEDEYNDAKMYISRPVTFESMLYKRLEQILVRMNLENLHKDIHGNYIQSPYNFYIFGSLDGKEYKLLQGGETVVSYLNDISLRRMFVDCKFFIFAYVCTHQQVEMLGIEAVVKPKFTKTMR